MLRRISTRRLLAVGLLVGVLAAVAPATGLAANGGGGPGPSHTVRRSAAGGSGPRLANGAKVNLVVSRGRRR